MAKRPRCGPMPCLSEGVLKRGNDHRFFHGTLRGFRAPSDTVQHTRLMRTLTTLCAWRGGAGMGTPCPQPALASRILAGEQDFPNIGMAPLSPLSFNLPLNNCYLVG